MSKTEQDLEGSTDDVLTDDAELIEVDTSDDDRDNALVDAIERYTASVTDDHDAGDRHGDDGHADDTGELEPVVTEVPTGAALNGTGTASSDVDEPEADDSDVAASDVAALDVAALDVAGLDVAESELGDEDDTADHDLAVDEVAESDVAESDVAESDVAESDVGDEDATADHDLVVDEVDVAEADEADEDATADHELDVDAAVDDATGEVFVDEPSNPFEIPPIVMATGYDADVVDASGEIDSFGPPAADPDTSGGTPLAPPAVSRDILEELRRADIDGPIVEMAPQDDTTSARRRPKKSIDYDPAPVPIPLQVPRILGRKPRVRKVTRVVRHVDPWSVFKIAIIANMVLYLIVLTAGVLLWNVAYATGTIDNVERFFESFGWQSFEFNGGEIYHSAWIAGLFVGLGMTGLAVLAATLFNLITDLVGGVRFTVLEEEVVESRSSPMRRFVVRRPEPEIPAVIQDPSGSIIREAIVDDTGDHAR